MYWEILHFGRTIHPNNKQKRPSNRSSPISHSRSFVRRPIFFPNYYFGRTFSWTFSVELLPLPIFRQCWTSVHLPFANSLAVWPQNEPFVFLLTMCQRSQMMLRSTLFDFVRESKLNSMKSGTFYHFHQVHWGRTFLRSRRRYFDIF